jgi:hypothetical protein
MWQRGLTLQKWCDLHNFNSRYARRVIYGKAGKWGVGNAQRIIDALKQEGYLR